MELRPRLPFRRRPLGLLYAALVALPVLLAAALAGHPAVTRLDNALVAGRGAAVTAAALPPEYVRVDLGQGVPTLEALPRIAAARPRAIVIVDGALDGYAMPSGGAGVPEARRARRAAERRSLVPLDLPILTWPLGGVRDGRVRLAASRAPQRPWHRCVAPPRGVPVAGARPASTLPNVHAAAMASTVPLRSEPWTDDPYGIRFQGPSAHAPGVGAVAARVLDGRRVADRNGPIAWLPPTPAFGAVAPVTQRDDLCRLHAGALRDRVVLLASADAGIQVPSPLGPTDGAELQAQVIETIRRGQPLRDLPAGLRLALVVLLGLPAVALTAAGAGIGRRVAWSLLGALALGAAFVAAFERGLLLPVAAPLAAAAGGALAAVACGAVAEVRDARAARRRAEALAATDPLTGLPNLRTFRAALEREIAAALRSGDPCTLIAFDLDHFKAVNDTLGHAAGDEVLTRTAHALRAVARRADLPARLGGEEFALLLPGTGAQDAAAVAERLRAAFRAVDVPGLARPVTASFGLATCPEDGVEAASLLAAADAAAYAAKRAGRDRVHLAAA